MDKAIKYQMTLLNFIDWLQELQKSEQYITSVELVRDKLNEFLREQEINPEDF